MARAFHNELGLGRGAVFIQLVAHVGGNKGILAAVDEQHGDLGLSYLPGGVAIVQTVTCQALVDLVGQGDHGGGRQVVHAVQYVGEHVLWGGEGGVGDNALHLGRQVHTADHTHGSAAHGAAVEDDLGILAHLIYRPADPLQSVQPVHAAKADVLALALSVGALVDDQGAKAPAHKAPGQAGVLAHTVAGVSMETDDHLVARTREVGAVELQAVMGEDTDLLMGLLEQPVPVLVHPGVVLAPVNAGHLGAALRLGVGADHGAAVEVGGAQTFCRSRQTCQNGGFFQQSHKISPFSSGPAGRPASEPCRCCPPPSACRW